MVSPARPVSQLWIVQRWPALLFDARSLRSQLWIVLQPQSHRPDRQMPRQAALQPLLLLELRSVWPVPAFIPITGFKLSSGSSAWFVI
jgi:hypothetical protein